MSLTSINQCSQTVFMIQMTHVDISHSTTIKVDTSCKIYFLEGCRTNDLMKEFAAGRAVITQKKNGKRSVFATQEVANQLISGAITLKSKKGTLKKIEEVTIVDLQFFMQLVQAAVTTTDAKTDAVQATSTEHVKTERRIQRQDKVDKSAPTKMLLALICKAAAIHAELLVAQNEARIIDNLRKKNEESVQEAREIVKRDVDRYELKRDIAKQSQRIAETRR